MKNEILVREFVLVELEDHAKNEEASWKKESSVCLQQGDKNRGFFQRIAAAHKRYNSINRSVIGGEKVTQVMEIKRSVGSSMKDFTLNQKIEGHPFIMLIVLRLMKKKKSGYRDPSLQWRFSKSLIDVLLKRLLGLMVSQ